MHRAAYALVVVMAAVMAVLPTTSAETSVDELCAPTFTTSSVGGVISSGPIDYCLYAPNIVSSTGGAGGLGSARISAIVTGPAGTTVAFTFLTNVINGCTISATSQDDTIGTFGSMTMAHWNIQFTTGSEQCHGLIKVTTTAGVLATDVYAAGIPFMIQTENTHVDNQNRLCAASTMDPTTATGPTCTDPTINVDLLDDTTDDASLTVPSALVNIGNQSVAIPDTLNVVSSSTAGDFTVPLFLWITALVIMLRFRKLLSAIACSVGVAIALTGPENVALAYGLPGALLLIGLWLEAMGKDQIVQRFFSPSPNPRA